ncbi:hypothetical protein LMH87_002187 [Akanthomyces muscarius]|uniref:non-specific serine/threonine protein kinase n=1 Tax=Akanthomyces muscarius TaxID=2231603 RepID=A0A9W8Q781_AKAMU|nr:hypothetical protein LMH87_002187 [Akanthomyces muscarius]KAJ4147679.1 hypothetical protein LMH87_002187 [Akanthomyces muscarius]
MASTKQRALDDAQHAQAAAVQLCRRTKQPLPPYRLTELIGKGSFGRVYKATTTDYQLVAVKVINIEHGDSLAPGLADTLADLHAEIRALQALQGGVNAPRSINRVVEALLVGPAVWLVLEYCAGGSVATLMRPSRPRGLHEKWIVPILRETAAALSWVHAQGIIHRDVKAANVLVGEGGGRVQLCDFGVAATLRGRGDRRTTVVGTAHWMAPELLGSGSRGVAASYGSEVDVWAFGALAYELAMGHPPNAALGMVGLARLGRQLQTQSPRLEGEEFSEGIRDLVACCLQREPERRPTMAAVQDHGYIAAAATEEKYPTETLAQLVRAFRIWEAQGGDRRSLFAEGGAAVMQDDDDAAEDAMQEDWNFSTAFEMHEADVLDASDVANLSVAYGIGADSQETQQPRSASRQQRRRRQPRRHMAVKPPLEKVFDSNTLSNYDDYSRQYYTKFLPEPVQRALLQNGVTGPQTDRESLIDLDVCVVDGSSSSSDSVSSSVDMGTVRPAVATRGWKREQVSLSLRLGGTKRATQEWRFPVMFPQPAPEEPDHFPSRLEEIHESSISDISDSRSESADGLIDLDMSTILPSTVRRHQREERQRTQEPPPLPSAPLPQVIMGQAADEQVKDELHRMTASLADHLRYATAYLADLPIRRIHVAASG